MHDAASTLGTPSAVDRALGAGTEVRVGLIGLGAIGLGVCRLARKHPAHDVHIVGALVRDIARSRGPDAPPVVATVGALLALDPEVILECAGHEALRTHGEALLRAGHDVITLSVGSLADPTLLEMLQRAARAGGASLRIASGAIAGLDALAAAAVGGLDRVLHEVRKPARTLLGDAADGLAESRELYRGPAREGVRLFPESVNVCAAVSLAGIGFDRTELRVVADPFITRNQHTVKAAGTFGELLIEVRNVPSDENPRTGLLTAMSAFREIRRRREVIQIG